MSDLIQLQKAYILETLHDVQTPHGIKFLVIDKVVKNVFDYLFLDINELLKYVTSVDIIDAKDRKGEPSSEAIYLLQPTKYNINCIDADFSNSPPKYKKANIRFLPGFDEHLEMFLNHKRYVPQNLRSLAEMNISFIPKESQYFETMGVSDSMKIFYNMHCSGLIEESIKKTVHSLINICIVTGEYPIIRFSEPNEDSYALSPASIIAKKVAFEFQNALDDYARGNDQFPPSSSRPRAIFLITARSLDLFSPVIHSFTYQAMAYDLVANLNLSNESYSYKAENELGEIDEKVATIRELTDPDWYNLRHEHIIDARETINFKINSFIEANPLLVDRSKAKTSSDIVQLMANRNNFDEERRRYTYHKTLINECLSINEKRNLANIANFEQIVSGFGQTMEGVKVKHLEQELISPVLASSKPNNIDKVRYIILYALYRGGLIEQDFGKLLTFIGINKEHSHFASFMTTIKNFENLGFRMIKETPKDKGFNKEWHHETILNDPTIYNSSRFIPAIGNNLSKMMTNSLLLDDSSFPYTKDKPIEIIDEEQSRVVQTSNITASASLRSTRHKAAWSIKKNTENEKVQRQRFFYYIVGGITHNELKAAYDQSSLKNKDVFIGSDSILTPLGFMAQLQDLTSPRSLLNLEMDKPQPEKAPEFLYDRVNGSARAPSHVHIQKHNPSSNTDVKKVPANEEKEPVKEKKRSRFKKLFK